MRRVYEAKELEAYLVNDRTVVFSNPQFKDFQYRDQGQVTKMDEMRKRTIFTCSFTDVSSGAEGDITAIILTYFQAPETVDYEKLQVRLKKPVKKKVDVIGFNVMKEEEVYPAETPRGYARSRDEWQPRDDGKLL